MPSIGWMLMRMPPDSLPALGVETPSGQELRAAVEELLVQYEDQALLDRLRTIRKHEMEEQQRGVHPEAVDRTDEVRRLLLPKQQPILRHLGFPTDEVGVALLQNAIHRRICEGDVELKRLANKALNLLTYSSMPTLGQEVSAEQMFGQINDSDAAQRNLDLQDVLCEAQDDEERDWKIADLRALMKPRGDVTLGMLKVWTLWEALGLPAQLRVRPDVAEMVVRLHQPTAQRLFSEVMQNRPVIITGAVDEASFPPLRDFNDFDYLRQRCGSRMVKVKADTLKDREGHRIYCTDPTVEMPFTEYLALIEETERSGSQPSFYMGKNPLPKELPELVEDIERAAGSPVKQYRSCFGSSDVKTYMYFGCGHNTSAVHFDPSENLLLVISGRKTYELYPPQDVDCLYPCKPPQFSNSAVRPCLKPDQMTSEELQRWPLYRHARPLRVTLERGEMLYLPIFWWHGVVGSAERNMQVNWWCDMHVDKVEKGDPENGAHGLLKHIVGILQQQASVS